jgi:hypothetical protein
MYFLTKGGSVYHVLSDKRNGAAPCGARLSRFDVSCLHSGRPTPSVVAQKPEGAPLCKHCEQQKEVV